MPMLRERQHQLRETAIVEAMQDLLARQGYAATSMDDVAAQLGISKATLYLHFKSKAELALRVMVSQIEASEADMQALDPALPAIERVRQSLRSSIRRRATLGAAQIQLPLELYGDRAFQAAERKITKNGEVLIKEAQRSGDIRTDLRPALITEFVANIYNLNFERLTRAGEDVDTLSEQVIEMVMRAIQP